MVQSVEFIYSGEVKKLDYYILKYGVSNLEGSFNEYWEDKNFYNGDKIGINKIIKDSQGKLVVYYFKTDYKTAMFVRNFLYQLEDEGKLKLDKEDYRCNMGCAVLLRDSTYGIFSKRRKDWYGNNVDNHYLLTASEGLEESDAEDLAKGVDKLYQRALQEEVGISLPKGLETRLGYVIGRDTVLYIEVYVDNISILKYDLTKSTDSLEGIEDIVGCGVLEIATLKYNKSYTPTLNDYLTHKVNWLA